jgi:hypothetical protein
MGVLTKSTSRGSIDKGDEAFTFEFVENVVTLTQTLGVILFRPLLKIKSQEGDVSAKAANADFPPEPDKLPIFRFAYTQDDIPAQMVTDGKDFVILKGSKARPDGVGIPGGIKQMRDAARAAKILTKDSGSSLEVFQTDYPTTSVSTAGAMIYGSPCRGPVAWRHIGTGELYSEWVAGNAKPTVIEKILPQ